MARTLTCSIEHFPLAAPFTISRGAKTEAVVVTASILGDSITGRGECVPYARYGETPDTVLAAIEAVRAPLERGVTRAELQGLMPPGAARNALDCALWDYDAKRLGIPAREMAGQHSARAVTTAYTISAGEPGQMARAAAAAAHYPILKIKLAGEGDIARIAAVRAAAPNSELIADGNEGCDAKTLQALFEACAQAGVALIEQPLPAGGDEALAHMKRIVPVCADESVHDRTGLEALRDRYDAINIKLDKTGGLTEALALAAAAQSLQFSIMVGSMVGTSLSVAPALLVAPFARWVDLDGPLLLARDRMPGLQFNGASIAPANAAVWG